MKTAQDYAREFADWFYYSADRDRTYFKPCFPKWVERVAAATHKLRPENISDWHACRILSHSLAAISPPDEWENELDEILGDLVCTDQKKLTKWLYHFSEATKFCNEAACEHQSFINILYTIQQGQKRWLHEVATILIREFRKLAEGGAE